jgi:hypothetical protein
MACRHVAFVPILLQNSGAQCAPSRVGINANTVSISSHLEDDF